MRIETRFNDRYQVALVLWPENMEEHLFIQRCDVVKISFAHDPPQEIEPSGSGLKIEAKGSCYSGRVVE